MQECSLSPGDDADAIRASRPGQRGWGCGDSVRSHRQAIIANGLPSLPDVVLYSDVSVGGRAREMHGSER
jgi:hypothetical protein